MSFLSKIAHNFEKAVRPIEKPVAAAAATYFAGPEAGLAILKAPTKGDIASSKRAAQQQADALNAQISAANAATSATVIQTPNIQPVAQFSQAYPGAERIAPPKPAQSNIGIYIALAALGTLLFLLFFRKG